MFAPLVAISKSRLTSSSTANELGHEVYTFWIYICFLFWYSFDMFLESFGGWGCSGTLLSLHCAIEYVFRQ